jgi:hypothetical protein
MRSAIVLIASSLMGLGSCKTIARPAHVIVDCLRLEAPAIATEARDLLALVPAWQQILDKAKADAPRIGWEVVGCALAAVTHEKKSDAKAATLETARTTMESFRAQVANGATFRTAEGDL